MLEKTLLTGPWTAWKSNQSIKPGNQTDDEALILWPPDVKSQFIRKDPDGWERLKAGEGDDKGQDGWMVSPTRWT